MNESRPEDSEHRPEDVADSSAGDEAGEAAESARSPRETDQAPDETPESAASDQGAETADTPPAQDADTDTGTDAHPETAAADGTRQGSSGPPGAGPPARRRGGWALFLVLLIALAAGGAAGYLGWRLHQLEQRVERIPAERAAALQPYLKPDALQPLQSRIESLEARRQALSEELGDRVDRLAESIEAMRAITERHQIGWRLAEIRYLLSVATRRLTIAYDMDGAEAALGAADDAVASLQDVRLIPLRKAIIEDLGAVREVQPADIEGIALRLQSLLNQVDGLPRAPLDSAAGGEARDGRDGWLARLRDRLADFVVIQRRPGGPAPVVPKNGGGLGPADALTLALEDARRAALARDEAAYGQALQRAAETLDAHFDGNAGATIRFREGLADLARRTVETDVPDLTDTLELARKLAAEVEQARREAAPAAPAPADEAPEPAAAATED